MCVSSVFFQYRHDPKKYKERQLSVFLIETGLFLMKLNYILLEDLVVYKLLNYNLTNNISEI